MFVDEFYFDSYGCRLPIIVIIKLLKLFFQNIKFRKMIVFCTLYCFYVLYLTQVLGFENSFYFFARHNHEVSSSLKEKLHKRFSLIVSRKQPQPNQIATKSKNKKLTKDRQEFLVHLAASGFKDFLNSNQ